MSTADKFMKDIEQWGLINALYFGGVLVYAGTVFVADSLGVLPQIGDASAWSWIVFGAGIASLVGNLIRQASPNIINPSAFDYVFGAVLLAIGLGGFTSMYITLSLLLLVVGSAILYRALFRTGEKADNNPHEAKAEMTEEDYSAPEASAEFDVAACMETMEKMMQGHSEGCNCDEMMSQFAGQEGIPEEWQSVMSQMMEVHCAPQEEPNQSVIEV